MPGSFVSYTAPDEPWAEWIAWALEEAGFSTVLQKLDFAAGTNFVLEMHKAAAQAKCTVAVLSPDYLASSRFGAAEWAAAFAGDPDGQMRRLIPVRVRDCNLGGLLKPIVYIDLVGLGEAEAKQCLLADLAGTRRKPAQRPSFPGAAGSFRPFPGKAQVS